MFDTMRQLNGLIGISKVNESPHDAFNTGHSSTSISAALGIAKARDIKRKVFCYCSDRRWCTDGAWHLKPLMMQEGLLMTLLLY